MLTTYLITLITASLHLWLSYVKYTWNLSIFGILLVFMFLRVWLLLIIDAARHITLSEGPYYVGDVISCSADANPSLTFDDYTWVVMATEYEGQTLILKEEMTGMTPVTCCGTNTIRGQHITTCDIFDIEIESESDTYTMYRLYKYTMCTLFA